MKPDADKVSAITNAARPSTKKQLRSFLRLVSFYHKFVPNFAHIELSLTDLTKKGCPTKLVLENCHELAFQTLKLTLTCFQMLKLTYLQETFVLATDVYYRGLGADLFQFEQDKKLHIAYASWKLKDCEYATIEILCLAIVWAIHKFQKYLNGMDFVLETDYSSLVYFNKSKVANLQLMRLALKLTALPISYSGF